MITNNQVSTIESTEVEVAPSTSIELADEGIAPPRDSIVASTVVTDSNLGSESTSEQSSDPLSIVQTISDPEASTSGIPSALPWVSITLTIVFAYFLYKLKKELDSLKKKIDGDIARQEKASQTTEIRLQDMARRLTYLHDMDNSLMAKLDSLAYKIKENRKCPPNLEPNTVLVEAERQTSVNQGNKGTLEQCYYGNPFSPDENGVVKFSTRSLSKEQSPQKMFFVCLHQDGTGTYEVNPSANEYILSDLQLFSYYVKSFNVKGQLTNARVKTLRPGKLVKSDKFWVIEELLEVSIK